MKFHLPNLDLETFPEDIIDKNGDQIFEFLQFLTGTKSDVKENMDGMFKKGDRIKKLYKQYSGFITKLKVQGALLNTIRPEFLLDL